MTSETFHLCPRYERAVKLLGKPWTGLILRVLGNGPSSFSRIARAVDKLSDRVLSERLKELEQRGVVERRVEATMPVKITYSLTEKGRDLQQVLDVLHAWADQWETLDSAEQELAASATQV